MTKNLEHFYHPGNLPSVHPELVKGVKIVSSEGDTTTFEQDATMLGRKIHSLNKLTVDRADFSLRIDTLEGDGKGSRITVSFAGMPDGTRFRYLAEMGLGPLFHRQRACKVNVRKGSGRRRQDPGLGIARRRLASA